MNELDPDFMALFSTIAFTSSDDLIETIGLSELMPGAIIDAKIFEPCGFSLNAINKVSLIQYDVNIINTNFRNMEHNDKNVDSLAFCS